MHTWIALFRGINVGGKNILPMANLREDLAALQFLNVRTYIQSGNVILESRSKSASAIGTKIKTMVKQEYGFSPQVLVLKIEELETASENNPFLKATADPKTLHFMFLASDPETPDLESLEELKIDSESYELIDRVFYLHAPDGIARSKLAAKAEKLLGVFATARNYRTVAKILEIAK